MPYLSHNTTSGCLATSLAKTLRAHKNLRTANELKTELIKSPIKIVLPWSTASEEMLCTDSFQDESGSLSSGESNIGVDDDDDGLLDDDDLDEGRGEGRDDGSQANSLNDSDNDF